jgi:hypothetical protein
MMTHSREIQNGHIQNVLYAHKHIGDVFQSNGTERLCVGGGGGDEENENAII